MNKMSNVMMNNNIEYVTFNEYENEKQQFLKKHGVIKCYTSNIENNVYFKQYYTHDNKMFYERVETYCTIELNAYDEYHKCHVKCVKQCTKIEFWNDENAKSKFYVEIY